MYHRHMNTLKGILMSADPVSVLRKMDESGTLVTLDPLISGLRMEMEGRAHHKDNLEHSIRVLGHAIERETEPDLILRTAALLHDVGKPATRKFGVRKSVTFDGHETVGANIARKMLKRHGYSRSEIQEISELIALHMRSHGFEDNGKWTDSGVRRLIADVSTEDQMNRLFIIFYSDVTTKHDSKRKAIHLQVSNLIEEVQKVKEQDARKALRPALNGQEVMELLNMQPGRELGAVMRFLNSDEGVMLTKEDAIAEIAARFVNR